MTALAADRNTASKEGNELKWYPVAASTKIYKGSLVAINTSGYAVPAADSASFVVVGVADEQKDNTAGANGALKIRVVSGRSFKFVASSITQAMLGQTMYVVDDQTFDDAIGTNAVKAGRLVEFESTTVGWIFIPAGGNSRGISTADGSDATTTQTLANSLKAILNADYN